MKFAALSCHLDFAWGSCIQDQQLQAENPCCNLRFFRFTLG
jgi:hypothetical protein